MRIFLILQIILTLACQRDPQRQSVSWVVGDVSKAPDLKQLKYLEKKEEINSSQYRIVFYQQEIDGIAVDQAIVKTVVRGDSSLKVFNGSYYDNVNFDEKKIAEAKLKLQHVVESVLKKYPHLKKMSILSQRLLLKIDASFAEPLCEIEMSDPVGRIWLLTSDVTGEIQSMKAVGSQFQDVSASVFPLGPRKSSISSVQIKDVQLSTSLRSRLFNVSSMGNSSLFNTEELNSLSSSSEKFDQLQVFYYVQQALHWLDEKMNYKSSRVLDVQIYAGYPEKTNMAFYYDNKIRLGSGDDQTYSKISQDPSIVMHETFHSYIDSLCRLPFQEEGGSVNEALADIMTAIYLKQPQLGEVAYLKAPFKRSVENTSKYGEQNGGLYHDSLIVSGLLWEIYKKIGEEKALALLQSIIVDIGPMTRFEELRKLIHLEVKNNLRDKDLEMVQSILKNRGW